VSRRSRGGRGVERGEAEADIVTYVKKLQSARGEDDGGEARDKEITSDTPVDDERAATRRLSYLEDVSRSRKGDNENGTSARSARESSVSSAPRVTAWRSIRTSS